MLISARIIRRPRLTHYCSSCELPIAGPVLRLYGAANEGERPFNLYQHPDCTRWPHPKVQAALASLAGLPSVPLSSAPAGRTPE